MIATGLCSVTLRALAVPDVVRVAADAQLEGIEWGGDIHVPPGDFAAADRARELTNDAGLRVSSYGSYYRAGVHDPADVQPILDSAVRLRAPRVRIWAGDVDAGDATAEQWQAVVRHTRAAAELAADAGVRLDFEFHRGTLTNTASSALRLVGEIDHPLVGSYWQPPVGASDDDALDGLRTIQPHVSAVHVFAWSPTTERHPLEHRKTLWRRVFELLDDQDALLEFVRDDDPQQVVADAHTLTRLGNGSEH